MMMAILKGVMELMVPNKRSVSSVHVDRGKELCRAHDVRVSLYSDVNMVQ
jgi:hypothetical protein